jgi:hypothetical protein
MRSRWRGPSERIGTQPQLGAVDDVGVEAVFVWSEVLMEQASGVSG